LTRRLGDLPDGGDERLKNMEQVVLKLQNVLKELCLLADGLHVQGGPFIADLMTEAYETDLLPAKILETIPMNGSLKEIMVAERTEQQGKIRY
jgi:hypothetical protein